MSDNSINMTKLGITFGFILSLYWKSIKFAKTKKLVLGFWNKIPKPNEIS